MNNIVRFWAGGGISVNHKRNVARFERRRDGKELFRSSDLRLAHLDKKLMSFEYNEAALRADILAAL